MAKFKVHLDKNKCIGCGTCAAVCPANWEMKDDGKVEPIKTEIEKLGCNRLAEESCPTQAIEIEPISSKEAPVKEPDSEEKSKA